MKKITAVIFDLDGTLTQPYLDFDQIRAEIGDIDGPILEAMEQMSADDRRNAEEILHRHERLAARESQLNHGVKELFTWLRVRQMGIGLVTRNCRESVNQVSRIHNLTFDSIFTRDDGPAKPDPFPVLQVCRDMQVQPADSVVVGDYVFDLISGRRAGAWSVLFQTNDSEADFSNEADYVISSLNELTAVIDDIENR